MLALPDRDVTRAMTASAAVASVALGSGFHAAAGGGLPGWPVLAMVGALTYWLTSSVLRRTAHPAALALVVAGGQALVHLALTATAGHSHGGAHEHTATTPMATPSSSGAAPGTLAAELGAGGIPAEALGVDPLALALHRITEELTPDHAAMSVAHVVAGVLVGAWLAWGARAIRAASALLTPLRRALAVQTAPLAPTMPRAAALVPRVLFVVRSQHRTSVAGRRGPPLRQARARSLPAFA